MENYKNKNCRDRKVLLKEIHHHFDDHVNTFLWNTRYNILWFYIM